MLSVLKALPFGAASAVQEQPRRELLAKAFRTGRTTADQRATSASIVHWMELQSRVASGRNANANPTVISATGRLPEAWLRAENATREHDEAVFSSTSGLRSIAPPTYEAPIVAPKVDCAVGAVICVAADGGDVRE